MFPESLEAHNSVLSVVMPQAEDEAPGAWEFPQIAAILYSQLLFLKFWWK